MVNFVEEEEIADLPEPTQARALVPEGRAREQAFYAASMVAGGRATPLVSLQEEAKTAILDEHERNYDQISTELQTQGESELLNRVQKQFETEEDHSTRQVLTDFIGDPNVDKETKKQALLRYTSGRGMANTLKDRYTLKAAAEDHSVTEMDKVSQDILLDSFQEARDNAAEVQLLKDQFGKGLSGTNASFAGGIAQSIFVPGSDAAEFTKFLNDVDPSSDPIKNFLLPGSAKKAIGQKYENMSDEQKIVFLKAAGESLSNTPGFDYNKYQTFLSATENPDMHWGWVTFENALGLLEAAIVGKAITAPIKSVKGFLKWLKPADNFFKFGAGAKTTQQAQPRDRVDPTYRGAYDSRAANAPTGSQTGSRTFDGEFTVNSVTDIPKELGKVDKALLPAPKDVDGIIHGNAPGTPPNSPLGIINKVNPQKATKAQMEALLDDSGKIAQMLGTTRGDIIADSLPKWTKHLDEVFPDIAAKMRQVDEYFSNTLDEHRLDPFFVDTVQREKDKSVIHEIFKEARGVHYQASNSTMQDSLSRLDGTAVFGRNGTSGWNTRAEAEAKFNQMKDELPMKEKNSLRIVKKGNGIPENAGESAKGQYHLEYDYAREYDPFTEFAMGTQTVNAKIYPIPFSDVSIDASSWARSFAGTWIFPPTTMFDSFITHGAAVASMKTSKVIGDFTSLMQKEIMSVGPLDELHIALRKVQESQEWESLADISTANSHLSTAEIKEVYSGYVNYRRLTDYSHAWTNMYDRRVRTGRGQKAIYHEDGRQLGFGVPVNPDTLGDLKYAWDMDTDQAVRLIKDAKGKFVLNGREIVKFDGSINKGADEIKSISEKEGEEVFSRLADDNHFSYGIIGNKTSLGPLPATTVPRIEGYVPRTNIENYYVKKTPKSVRLDGVLITDPKVLSQYAKTVGAAKSESDGRLLASRFGPESPNYEFSVALERGDSADAIYTDYKAYTQHLSHSKKRGERLPTLNGLSRLEDPMEAIYQSINTSVRLGVWGDYSEINQKNFIRAYGEFLSNGEFPNVITDLVAPAIKTRENIAKFQAAQAVFSQYTNQQYKATRGDEVYKAIIHPIADVLEKMHLQSASEAARNIARKGDIPIRSLKSLSSAIFLHLNVPRQWMVQTQQLAEWGALDPLYAAKNLTSIPALGLAILSKGSMMGSHGGEVYKMARATSPWANDEFDKVFDAIYKNGLPQSVDLNMMLHGMFHDAKYAMDQSVGKTPKPFPYNLVTAPYDVVKGAASGIGKGTQAFVSTGRSLGYTPAELSNTIGTWLFARDRWIKANPGQDWSTPQNTARISGEGWDLANSMSTRAGAMPYQDGALGLIFQYFAAPHKALMTLFSGKTLSTNDRGKLIAAKMAIWGMYGTAGGALIDQMVTNIADPEFQAQWHEWKGGMVDAVTNKLIIDNLKADGSKESTLMISAAISPLSGVHVFYDVTVNLLKMIDGSPTNPRFAFTGAMGAIYEAVNDIQKNFQVNEYNTLESLLMIGNELAEITSGYNNWAHASHIAEYGKKVDKFGRTRALELTQTDAFFQMFGVITREEAFDFPMTELKFGEKDYIEQRAKEINDFQRKNRDSYGSDSWDKFHADTVKLNSLDAPEVRDAIRQRVFELYAKDETSNRDSNLRFIQEQIQQKNTAKFNAMVGYLRASKDPESQRVLKELTESGLLN